MIAALDVTEGQFFFASQGDKTLEYQRAPFSILSTILSSERLRSSGNISGMRKETPQMDLKYSSTSVTRFYAPSRSHDTRAIHHEPQPPPVVVVSCWLLVLTRHNTAEAGRFIVYVHYFAARQI